MRVGRPQVGPGVRSCPATWGRCVAARVPATLRQHPTRTEAMVVDAGSSTQPAGPRRPPQSCNTVVAPARLAQAHLPIHHQRAHAQASDQLAVHGRGEPAGAVQTVGCGGTRLGTPVQGWAGRAREAPRLLLPAEARIPAPGPVAWHHLRLVGKHGGAGDGVRANLRAAARRRRCCMLHAVGGRGVARPAERWQPAPTTSSLNTLRNLSRSRAL
jgi:hypothetical protein